MRWELAGAIQHVPVGHPLRQRKEDIIARRGDQAKNIAQVAVARQLLTWIYYAMRGGQVRALAAGRVRPHEQQAQTQAARDRWFYWSPPGGGRPPGLIDPAART